MATKTILFVEGEPNSPNGDLRKGFSGLLSAKLAGNMPRIIMGGGKTKTIEKFKNNTLSDYALALLDLDNPEEKRDEDLSAYGLTELSANVFYMIQEMESWFLSQPLLLDNYFGKDRETGKKVSEKMTKAKPETIVDPKGELKKITKNTPRGVYNEITHAIDLLKSLDVAKLEGDFKEFKKLIEKLQ